jgi:hypothetical protein
MVTHYPAAAHVQSRHTTRTDEEPPSEQQFVWLSMVTEKYGEKDERTVFSCFSSPRPAVLCNRGLWCKIVRDYHLEPCAARLESAYGTEGCRFESCWVY